ncbi:TadE family protein [Rhodopirellula maiorica SM1]|uniref:TadE family protein n=1 Tax=Rhodopirellula maiorica SM1 TaxID=1265738 RepID=M5S7T7_9BACT|nr:TadE/TadG family type IV pilus assembly protein [Rhodopirellula maiorica]EMI22234.1 TadE family protein [Rhodopirellula maiorica SM1]
MVELAVCMPVLFLVVFASIEACNMIAMKQIICESAYEGALIALKPDSTESQVVDRVNATLASRGVTPSGVVVAGSSGAAYSALARGDEVTVTVQAATNGNVVGPQLFGFAKTVSHRLTAIKQ